METATTLPLGFAAELDNEAPAIAPAMTRITIKAVKTPLNDLGLDRNFFFSSPFLRFARHSNVRTATKTSAGTIESATTKVFKS